MTQTPTVTLAVGQAVYWPPSPTGYAQVAELRRTNVVLLYPVGRRGHVCRPVVPAARVAELLAAAPLLFAMDNPFGRGFWPRSKAFGIPPPVC